MQPLDNQLKHNDTLYRAIFVPVYPLQQRSSLNPFAYREEGATRWRLDWHLILFAVNLALVPAGYYAGIRFGALPAVKAVRVLMMGFSLVYLLVAWQRATQHVSLARHLVLVLLIGVNAVMLPFAVHPIVSTERLLTVAPFWLYTNLLAYSLAGRYGPRQAMLRVVGLIGISYLFVVAVFYINGSPFARLSIYGDDSTGFVSNQLGWAGALCAACLVDMRPGWPRGLAARLGWVALVGACLWLVLISGSRSSYLSVMITLALVLVANRSIKWPAKAALVALACVAVVFVSASADSALNQRIRKSEAQLETVEPRILSARQAFQFLDKYDERWLTGVGFDLYGEAIWLLSGVFPGKPHNSYLEMIVNTGLLASGVFLLGLVLPALLRFAMLDAGRFSFLPTVLIIPYFENNLGAGQFLFYPWMMVLFLYLHDVRPLRLGGKTG